MATDQQPMLYEDVLRLCQNTHIQKVERFLRQRRNRFQPQGELAQFLAARNIHECPIRLYDENILQEDCEQIADFEIMYESYFRELSETTPEHRILDKPTFVDVNWTHLLPMNTNAYPIEPNGSPGSPADWVLDQHNVSYQELGRDLQEDAQEIHTGVIHSVIGHAWGQRLRLLPPERGINDPYVANMIQRGIDRYEDTHAQLKGAIQAAITQHILPGTIRDVLVAGIESMHPGVRELAGSHEIRTKHNVHLDALVQYQFIKHIGELIQTKRSQAAIPEPGVVDKFCFQWPRRIKSILEESIRVDQYKRMIPQVDPEGQEAPPETLIYNTNSTDFWTHMNNYSVVVSIKPQYCFRQQLADFMWQTQVYVPVIICETVYPDDHDYPDTGTLNNYDPSHPLLNYILNYNGYRVVPLSNDPTFGNLSMYVRADAYMEGTAPW